jgi:hypothetical protein
MKYLLEKQGSAKRERAAPALVQRILYYHVDVRETEEGIDPFQYPSRRSMVWKLAIVV